MTRKKDSIVFTKCGDVARVLKKKDGEFYKVNESCAKRLRLFYTSYFKGGKAFLENIREFGEMAYNSGKAEKVSM